MNFIQFFGALEMGLIFGLMSMGVLLSFRILDFPDLTVDGSFPLGAGVCAILICEGWDPWAATFVAILAGMGAGFITAWMSVRWNILHLLAGILTLTALYSVNLRVMGGPNVSLLREGTLFTFLENLPYQPMWLMSLFLFVIVTGVFLLLNGFLRSQKGLAMRAVGANSRMAEAQGVAVKRQILFGIALSNGLVAFSGALFAQSQGFADVTLGPGTIIAGLAAVIIGEAIFNPKVIWAALIACVIGSIVYRFIIAMALNMGFLGLHASDQQLITAVLVGIAMMVPTLRAKVIDFKSTRNAP